MAIRSINPATGVLRAEFHEASTEEVAATVKRARDGWAGWAGLKLEERLSYVRAFSNILRSEAERLAALASEEMGKPIKESRAELKKCVLLCDDLVKRARIWLADEEVETEARKSYVSFAPLGTIGAIEPWNYPFGQAVRAALPALIAGNTVVLKHSSVVPGCTVEIAKLFEESSWPVGVFQTVLGSADVGEALIKSEIDGLAFTGSAETGARVAQLAGRGLKKTVLELGGSDPFIVLEEADISNSCVHGVEARFRNCGQSCTAAKRFILHEQIAEQFIEKFVERVKGLKVGDPLDPQTDMGPMVREEQLKKIEEQVADARTRGAKLLLGGERIGRKGFWYAPTVLSDVKPGMRVWDEETFGPVAAITIVKNEEEALRLANASRYGLAASIWTADRARGEALARRIRAGTVFVNGVPRSDPRMPFGGIKESGWGRELARYGLLEWTNIKSVKIF